jgi:hypothetical protein
LNVVRVRCFVAISAVTQAGQLGDTTSSPKSN